VMIVAIMVAWMMDLSNVYDVLSTTSYKTSTPP